MSDVAWELAVSTEMLWKHSHSNVRRIGNRVVGGPMAICHTVHESGVVGLALHAMVDYCLICIGEIRGSKFLEEKESKRDDSARSHCV